MSKVLDTVKEITVFNGQDTTSGLPVFFLPGLRTFNTLKSSRKALDFVFQDGFLLEEKEAHVSLLTVGQLH